MKKKSAKQKILEHLIEAQRISAFWWSVRLPSGYVTTGHLCGSEVGGSSAPRRVREMRAAGIEIEIKPFSCINQYGEYVHAYIYALKTDKALINIEKGILKQNKAA